MGMEKMQKDLQEMLINMKNVKKTTWIFGRNHFDYLVNKIKYRHIKSEIFLPSFWI